MRVEIHESEPILTYDELITLSFALLTCKMSILELCRWNEVIQKGKESSIPDRAQHMVTLKTSE